MMSEDQFIEIVSGALDRHVSRDDTVCREDAQWEAQNAARTISNELRKWGIQVPAIAKETPQ